MATEPGSLDTWGAALDQMDFWGASQTNPNDMKNNCVSVSVARMAYYRTVEDLWKKTYSKPLPDKGLSFQQIVDLLRRLGLRYEWKKFYSVPGGKSAFELMHTTFYRNVNEVMLACYKRVNGSGHCIVVAHWPSDFINEIGDLTFWDFQHSEDGNCSYLRADVAAAKEILVFYGAAHYGTEAEFQKHKKDENERRRQLASEGYWYFEADIL